MIETRNESIAPHGSRLVCGCPMCRTGKGEIGCRHCKGMAGTRWVAATVEDLNTRRLSGHSELYPFKSLETGEVVYVPRIHFHENTEPTLGIVN